MKMIIALCTFIFALMAQAETGILIIAHGTMNHAHINSSADCTPHHYSSWEQYVLKTVEGIKPHVKKKIEVSFGMWDSHCFDQSIDKLSTRLRTEGKKLDHLIVFPLFISSHSEVIEMQKFIFKKRPDIVIPIPHVHPTSFTGQITYMNALDYDPHVSMILANRFHTLIHDAKDAGFKTSQMELILVMHGPVDDQANVEWMKMGELYNRDVTYLFPVSKSHVISLRDDAPSDVRDQVTAQLRSLVTKARENQKIALVLPLLISKGGIDGGILDRLKGLEYIWSGEALLPDPKLQDLVLTRLNHELNK